MYYREVLPDGKVIITDSSGNVRIFRNSKSANYYESLTTSDSSWAKAKRLPELTPKEQIRTMFNEVLGPDPIPNLWPKDLLNERKFKKMV